MSDDEPNQMVCAFCSAEKELGMQVLPNGDPMLLCSGCASAMQIAAETAQKQFDTLTKAAVQREIQTRFLLVLGACFLATGASIWQFDSSPFAAITIFGGCLFVWGILQRFHA